MIKLTITLVSWIWKHIVSLVSGVFYLLELFWSRFAGIVPAEPSELSIFERKIILPVLRYCRIPCHIGFIMDGNRRFARSRNSPSLFGHQMGFEKLRRVLLWCFELGVKEVSVYAFSMDNFSRSKEEVDYLMDLAESKLENLCDEGGFVMKRKIKIKICGEMELLRPSLQRVIQRVESKTSHHNGGTFNVLLAYSSKREVSRAMERASACSKEKTVSWECIRSNLYIPSPVDLIVRTSGETRLSDFLIWQIKPEATVLVFERNLWPAFSLKDLAKCLLRYHYRTEPTTIR